MAGGNAYQDYPENVGEASGFPEGFDRLVDYVELLDSPLEMRQLLSLGSEIEQEAYDPVATRFRVREAVQRAAKQLIAFSQLDFAGGWLSPERGLDSFRALVKAGNKHVFNSWVALAWRHTRRKDPVGSQISYVHLGVNFEKDCSRINRVSYWTREGLRVHCHYSQG